MVSEQLASPASDTGKVYALRSEYRSVERVREETNQAWLNY